MGYEWDNDCVRQRRKKSNAKDAIGKRYGKLIVLEIAGKGEGNKTLMRCKCDCGNEKIIVYGNLNSGRSNSCGCIEKQNYERFRNLNKSHGKSKTRLYNIWAGMKGRCLNPQKTDYKRYGGRGIFVCKNWVNDYSAFEKWALENGYKNDLTIERINVDKGYSPDNCCWVSRKEQGRNKENTKYVEYNNIKRPLTEWAEELGISYWTLRGRKDNGWTDKEVIEGRKKNGI